jgi:hypothetical protein
LGGVEFTICNSRELNDFTESRISKKSDLFLR